MKLAALLALPLLLGAVVHAHVGTPPTPAPAPVIVKPGETKTHNGTTVSNTSEGSKNAKIFDVGSTNTRVNGATSGTYDVSGIEAGDTVDVPGDSQTDVTGSGGTVNVTNGSSGTVTCTSPGTGIIVNFQGGGSATVSPGNSVDYNGG